MKTNIHFLIISPSVLLIMRNVSDKSCRGNQNIHFMFCDFFFENRAGCEIRWKNVVERGRPQVTLWRMRIACWMTKATPHTHTHTHTLRTRNTYCFSHYNNGCTNAHQIYAMRTLPVLLKIATV